MANTGFEFESKGIGSVLKDDTLIVPPHQRDYAWSNEEVLQLLNDLAAARSKGADYFLGTIVTITSEKDKKLQIVDGQQRITTTAILYATFQKYLERKNIGATALTYIDAQILNTPDKRHGKIPRLTLNLDDNDFFRRLLELGPFSKELHPTRDSHDRLVDAFKTTTSWVNSLLSTVAEIDVVELINNWTDYLENEAAVVLLKASNGARAFKMFETLNDRGLGTSQADLVKSFLFGESGDSIPEAQASWSAMLDKLHEIDDKNRTINFLKHVIIATREFVKNDEVYEAVQTLVKSEGAVTPFISELRRLATVYVATYRSDEPFWEKYDAQTKRAIDAYNRFDLKSARPLLLSIMLHFPPKKAKTAISFLVSVNLRLIIASKTRSGSVEQTFATCAQGINNKTIKSLKELKTALSKNIIEDAEFKEVFAKARTSNGPNARYFLRALQGIIDSEPEPQYLINDDPKAITLEHVLPKKREKDTWAEFEEETMRHYISRIGNMCLLQQTPNSSMPNDSFASKKPFLESSEFSLTSDLATIDVWDPNAIDSRQEIMSDLAIKAWPV